ncbi:MAG TPA: hypothetical protein ENF80_00515 [Thermofilum sp.]|nr:hypothetical protein [Thermofilum sp.]
MLENVRIRLPGLSKSYYFKTVLMPGFSDAHAHPQVVDVGNGKWCNSLEWIAHRRLKVDESSLRRDLVLSEKLAKVTILLSLLNGVTLLSIVGSLRANAMAVKNIEHKPRVVLMPTLMRGKGWSDFNTFVRFHTSLNGFENELVKMGVFIHSISYTNRSDITQAYNYSKKRKILLGMHLSEGISELKKAVRLLASNKLDIIGVHCIEDEKYEEYAVKIVHCPVSNIYLYNRTLKDPKKISCFGSDWPLLIGSVLNQYRTALRIHKVSPLFLLRKATIGGYETYGMRWDGDLVAFDEDLKKVVKGEVNQPVYVFVNGNAVVEERGINNLSINDIERIKNELIREAFDKHPSE